MIEWKDEYATGFEDIDEQHRDLFDFANRLESYVQQGIYEGPQVEMLLAFMGSYTQAHFFIEEMCMRNHKCPTSDKNDKAHKHFLKFYGDFKAHIDKHGASLALLQKLHDTLVKWLESHIMKIDIHLNKCVFKKGEVVSKNEKGDTVVSKTGELKSAKL